MDDEVLGGHHTWLAAAPSCTLATCTRGYLCEHEHSKQTAYAARAVPMASDCTVLRSVREPVVEQRVAAGGSGGGVGPIAQHLQRLADDDEVDGGDEEDVVVADIDGARVRRRRQCRVSVKVGGK